MPQIDHVTALAHHAAELLPAPPREGDVDAYLSWRELVWSTATRLGEIAGPALAPPTSGVVTVPGAKVTAQELLELARVAGVGRSTVTSDDAPVDLPARRSGRSARDCGARHPRRPVGTRLA